MTRGSITCDTSLQKTLITPPAPSMPTTSAKPPRTPLIPTTTKSPRNPSNKFWVQEQQRRLYLEHLKQWSMSHDSSTFFQGKISLLPSEPGVNEDLALGKSVTCVLTDSSFTDFRKTVAVRLFKPTKNSRRSTISGSGRNTRSKSMGLFSSEMKFPDHREDCCTGEDETWSLSQAKSNPSNSYYKLVIRCGSGWLSARDYLNRLYFTHLTARLPGQHIHCITDTADYVFGVRSQALGPPPSSRDTVRIQPLFHPFQRLPTELQEMILMTAAGLTRDYDLTNDPRRNSSNNHPKATKSPISLSTMLRISRHIHTTMQPYIFHRTTFHFGLSGTTNFLWQSGPVHRPHIKRLAFHFGKNALLHCVRWLAADPLFAFLQPPQPTGASGLPLFWRCQLRALALEVHLLELVLDIEGVPLPDVAMVARILRGVFGSVERVKFVEGRMPGKMEVVETGDERLAGVVGKASWRDMVKGYLERYRRQTGWHNWHFKMELGPLKEGEVDALMDNERAFFDS